MELTDLYSRKILELAGRLTTGDRLAAPDARARKISRICGSSIEVDLKLDEAGIVIGYAQQVEACALGQTSASVVAAQIIGATSAELRQLRDQMFAMLKQDGPPPSGRWSDLKYLEPVRDFAPRHTSTMLVFDAIVACLDQIEAQKELHA